jgi:hypothetical protein
VAYIDKWLVLHEEVTLKVEPTVPNARELLQIAKGAAMAELRARQHQDLWELKERRARTLRQR